MDNLRISKIIKVGNSYAFVIPANVCRDLKILRGEYFDLVISDPNTMVARRLKIIPEGLIGEAPDKHLPIIKHGK